MLSDITIGQYYKAESVLHAMDPRTKIQAILLFMISLFLVNNVYGFLFTFLGILGVLILSKVPLRMYIKGIKPLWVIIVFTALMQMLLTPGTTVWAWRFLHVTEEGLLMAFFMCSRLILLVLVTSVLTLTTTPIALTDAIEQLLNPFKRFGVPAHELAMMMTIALRFIPTLIEETDKIIKAQTARGADFESGNLINRAKALLPVLVPLFLSAFKRADELAMAMEARCYHGGEGRTRLHELVYTKKDHLALGVAVLFAAVTVATRFIG